MIVIDKVWEDYDDMVELHVKVTKSENTVGNVKFYCYPTDLTNFSQRLIQFPTKIPDEVIYEYGGDRLDSYSKFIMRAYVFNESGHTAIEFIGSNNNQKPEEEAFNFSITIDPMHINQLGQKLFNWSSNLPAISTPFEYEVPGD